MESRSKVSRPPCFPLRTLSISFLIILLLLAVGYTLAMEKIALSDVRFDLAPPEEEKLKVVAEIMSKRPKLTLEAQGQYDTVSDSAALKEVKLRQADKG